MSVRRKDKTGPRSEVWGTGGSNFEWFKQARASAINFDRSILGKRAMEMNEMLSTKNFTASNEWTGRFRARHGISYRQVDREAASVHPADIENWVILLPAIINAYDPKIMNAYDPTAYQQPTKSGRRHHEKIRSETKSTQGACENAQC
ncbi:hypothetical protein HPB48_017726 [Haemaphysalis longicornis]|uniref:HTH CENPB-type domain-containing protein n=1 Tax=Haemaphysalis longicornis TaxID=44386 RepID=A0A9J6FTA8_HAELO|nr:hypothetical protein HPB48_017726 [Haemaphysalis longicornis]